LAQGRGGADFKTEDSPEADRWVLNESPIPPEKGGRPKDIFEIASGQSQRIMHDTVSE